MGDNFMKKQVRFEIPSLIRGSLEERLGQTIEYKFPVYIVDVEFINSPREKSKTREHEIIVRLDYRLRVNWRLQNNEIIKVLFEKANELVKEKIKNNSLQEKEILILTPETEDDNCPFDISRIIDPSNGVIFEIDFPDQPTETFTLKTEYEQEIAKLPQLIQSRVPNCDPVIIAFIQEAYRCVYYANALLAANFMLGAASEKAIHLLIQKYADSIQVEAHKSSFKERINKRMISAKYDEFIRSYKSCHSRPTDPVLSQDLEDIIDGTFKFSRITRNEVGHPEVVPNPDRSFVMAHLGHFIVYIERVYKLMKYFEVTGVTI
jgi:hypothetical protein